MDTNPIDYGKPPKGGWAPIVCELYVSDIATSLKFWCDILGFTIAYQRPQERFAYLERAEGGQVMLYQPNDEGDQASDSTPARTQDSTDARDLEPKAMLQIYVDTLSPLIDAITEHQWPLLRGPEEVWRRWGDKMGGKREIRLSDPDGHWVLVGEDIGLRPLPQL